jgi:hypothetical protein
MPFMRIPLAAVTVTAIMLASAYAMSPQAVERAQPVHAAQVDRQQAVFSQAALSGAPGVLDALADENNVLAYVRVSRARNEVYFNDARSRCAMYRGKARETCVTEAHMKYDQPMPNPPL